MPLTYIAITGSFEDGSDQPVSGTVTFTPSQAVYDSGIPLLTPDLPVQAQVNGGVLQNASGGTVTLLSTGNSGLTIEGRTGFWFWAVAISLTSGSSTATDGWQFRLPLTPTTVDLYSLANSPWS